MEQTLVTLQTLYTFCDGQIYEPVLHTANRDKHTSKVVMAQMFCWTDHSTAGTSSCYIADIARWLPKVDCPYPGLHILTCTAHCGWKIWITYVGVDIFG